MYDYDVLFVGAGHASWHAALILLKAGKRVAFVEEGVVGGTCTNYGCNAKILLDTPFELIDGLERYRGLGVDDVPTVDWARLMAYKKQVISPLNQVMEGMFSKSGMEVLHGHGRLVDAHTVDVDGKRVTSDYLVLGTGERPMRQDIPGKELVHDSRDFLDVESFPRRIAFVGGGIISMEFASIAAKMGSQVKVIQRGDRVLRMYPERYVDRVVAKMEGEGVEFLFNQSVASVQRDGEAYLVNLADGDSFQTDYVLEATGRTPNVEGLGLEDVGVEFSARGIAVDDHMRTSVPNIYASGDCVCKRIPKLTPTATFESNYIATQILGLNPNPISYPAIPNLVFTLPRISQVGVTLAQAEAEPDEYRVEVVEYGKRLLFEAKNEADAEFSFVFDGDGYLVGAAFYGQDAGVWADLATMIINRRTTATELGSMIFTFPTESQGLLSLLIPLLPQK
jgi:glutathione reductase (NADPH)